MSCYLTLSSKGSVFAAATVAQRTVVEREQVNVAKASDRQ